MSEERIKDTRIHCPHCGHNVHVNVDLSEDEQDYLDECQACGGEIHLHLFLNTGEDRLHLMVDADDEQIY